MSKFTRIPKMSHLMAAGCTAELVPTYCALADYASNKSGLCWPSMRTLAAGIGRSPRTIQRHVHQLHALGLVQLVHRRRSRRGRFSSYLYRVVAVAGMAASKKSSTTGHGRRAANGPPIFPGTKQGNNSPCSPPEKDYDWLFAASGSARRKKISKDGGNTSPGGLLEAL